MIVHVYCHDEDQHMITGKKYLSLSLFILSLSSFSLSLFHSLSLSLYISLYFSHTFSREREMQRNQRERREISSHRDFPSSLPLGVKVDTLIPLLERVEFLVTFHSLDSQVDSH